MYLDSLKNITTTLTIYYDGQCPLCLAEIHYLKHHNPHRLLQFVSLQSIHQAECDINCELAMQTIHARLGEHKMITGPEVFFQAYQRTNLTIIPFLFSFRVIRYLYAKFYVVFAKHRHAISKCMGPTLLRIAHWKYPNQSHLSSSQKTHQKF